MISLICISFDKPIANNQLIYQIMHNHGLIKWK
uniref:Uncharacterized protein n=1 Tax=Rhizophora mucronata TaxID=61149 RepID=A0A2P2NCH4_RHIMU